MNGRKYYKLPGGWWWCYQAVCSRGHSVAILLPWRSEPCRRPGGLGRYYQTSPCAKSAHPSPPVACPLNGHRHFHRMTSEVNSSDSSELRGKRCWDMAPMFPESLLASIKHAFLHMARKETQAPPRELPVPQGPMVAEGLTLSAPLEKGCHLVVSCALIGKQHHGAHKSSCSL